MTEGLLVVDKPSGPTSHDVVAAARRALREKQIGHTGTLDPLATGVLALACGRATRLVRFLTASDKDYDADVRIGLTTDTYDVTGTPTGESARQPSHAEVENALAGLTGEYLQAPPPFSAKKIAGRRAYDLARSDSPAQPDAVPVRVARLELVELRDNVASLRVTCSAGFYVRSLAHDLGARLGTGACLAALRRTRSGEFTLADAATLESVVRDPDTARRRIVPLRALLPGFPAATLTEEGVRWVSHGRSVGPGQLAGPPPSGSEWVRLLDAGAALVAVATPGEVAGSLHPSVVLI